MTLPSGNPAWSRTNSFTDYGGDVAKSNYQSQGVVNPVTDVGAPGFMRMVSDVASVTRTAEFGVLLVQCDDTTPADPTVLHCGLMIGKSSTPYAGNAPPGGTTSTGLPISFPTAKRLGNGAVEITFASSYADEYGVSAAFVGKDPIATFVGSGGGIAVPELVSATVIRVRVFNLSNVAIANARFSLTIGSGT